MVGAVIVCKIVERAIIFDRNLETLDRQIIIRNTFQSQLNLVLNEITLMRKACPSTPNLRHY